MLPNYYLGTGVTCTGATSTDAMDTSAGQFYAGDDFLEFFDVAADLCGEINVDDFIGGLDGDRSPFKQSLSQVIQYYYIL